MKTEFDLNTLDELKNRYSNLKLEGFKQMLNEYVEDDECYTSNFKPLAFNFDFENNKLTLVISTRQFDRNKEILADIFAMLDGMDEWEVDILGYTLDMGLFPLELGQNLYYDRIFKNVEEQKKLN